MIAKSDYSSAEQFQRDKVLPKNTKITDSGDLSRPVREFQCLDFHHYQQSTCIEVPMWGACITNAILHKASLSPCPSPELLSKKHLTIQILQVCDELFYSPISDLLTKSLIKFISFLNITFSSSANSFIKRL